MPLAALRGNAPCPSSLQRTFAQIAGTAITGNCGEIGSMKAGRPRDEGLKPLLLHVIALNPIHPAQIDAHGESRSEDLADAKPIF